MMKMVAKENNETIGNIVPLYKQQTVLKNETIHNFNMTILTDHYFITNETHHPRPLREADFSFCLKKKNLPINTIFNFWIPCQDKQELDNPVIYTHYQF